MKESAEIDAVPGSDRRRKSRLDPFLPLVAASALLFFSCSKPVRIGVIASRTGAAASCGERVVKGVDLALRELQRTEGEAARIELIYRDDATHPDVGISAARDLIEKEGVRLILGAVSSPVTLRIAPLTESSRTLLLSPTASAPAIAGAGEWVFRIFPSDTLEGASLADFASDAGIRRVAIVAVDHEFGAARAQAFAERFTQAGRTILREEAFDESDAASFSRIAGTLAGLGLDGIYLVAYGGDNADLLRAIRAAGIRTPVLATSSVTDETLRAAGAAAELLVFPRSAFDPESTEPATRAFVEAYRRRYREEPDAFAAYGYDALRVLAAAVERAGSADPEKVRRALLALEGWRGSTGPIAFDEHGDVVQYPRLFVVEGGVAVRYERFMDQGGTLAPGVRS